MGLIKCHECGKKFSDQALSCPECSCPISIVKNNQEKDYYIKHLKEASNTLNDLNGDEKEKKLCECICFLFKLQNENEEIDFDFSLKGTKHLLEKINNIDKKYLKELDVSNEDDILNFILKRKLILELIDIQKKHNREIESRYQKTNIEIENSVENEVDYYSKKSLKSKNGLLYIESGVDKEIDKVQTKTYFYSFKKKGMVFADCTNMNEYLFIYDESLINDCQKINKNVKMYINQYLLNYFLYIILKDKRELSFNEIKKIMDKEIKIILKDLDDKSISIYSNILILLSKNYYYKIGPKNDVFYFNDNEEAKQDFEYWKDSYEKYFNAIETILSKEKILKLDEYKEYSNNKYKHELDGLDLPRLSLMCNVLKAYGFLDDKDNNGCFEYNIELKNELKEFIEIVISKENKVTSNELENNILKRFKISVNLKQYLNKIIINCLDDLEMESKISTYENDGKLIINVFSSEIEEKKHADKEKKEKEIEALKEDKIRFMTPANVLNSNEIKFLTLLISKKELYLEYFKESEDFGKLKKLFNELASNYNEYARSVLNMPMQQYKPMSSSTAGVLGTIVGGTTTGILAAERAEKKMESYNSSQLNYYSHKASMTSSQSKVEQSYYQIEELLYNNPSAKEDWIQSRKNIPQNVKSNGGCYVATCVYGSYDCPQVWTLRRFRDYELSKSWYGRLFIKTYYAISPKIVKLFGKTKWFNNMWRPKLDKMVAKLNEEGYESTPYDDIKW